LSTFSTILLFLGTRLTVNKVVAFFSLKFAKSLNERNLAAKVQEYHLNYSFLALITNGIFLKLCLNACIYMSSLG
jgi:hypothetical protein